MNTRRSPLNPAALRYARASVFQRMQRRHLGVDAHVAALELIRHARVRQQSQPLRDRVRYDHVTGLPA